MKGRKHKAHGGESMSGVREYEQDLASKPMRYTANSKVEGEAEARKHGGKAKKHVGKAMGHASKMHAGRKARKAGGRAGSDNSPLSSAHSGTPAKGRHSVDID